MSQEGAERRSIRLRPTHLGLGLILLGLVLVIIWGVQVYATVRSLEDHLRRVESLAEEEPMAVLRSDPESVGQLLHDLRTDVVSLRGQVGGLARLGPAFRWLPKVGPLLEEASPLLEMADGLTEAGVIMWEVFSPTLQALETGQQDTLEVVKSAVIAVQPQLGPAGAAVERAQEARGQIDIENLPWRFQGPMRQLDEMLPLLVDGLAVAEVAPDLLGVDEPRTFLVVAQNEEELRPTGGFISAALRVTVDGGEITSLDFVDANLVDDYANKPYPDPPEPLTRYMGLELWLFRDANWSPDFPSSARKMAYFYEYGQDVEVDGVIATDQRALELLVDGLGGLRLPEVDGLITGANLRPFMRSSWNPDDEGTSVEWALSRKDFIGELAQALLDQIEGDPGSMQWLGMGQALYRALEEKHILLFFENQEVMNVLSRLHWDGALLQSPGDYLMVVDTNVGYNKVNPLVEKEITYRVALEKDGTAEADLSIAYLHQGGRTGVDCEHFVPYGEGLVYEQMMHRCFYNYLRVYVPEGSSLGSATPHYTPAEYMLLEEPVEGQATLLDEDLEKVVFAQFFVVEYGETLETNFEYALPQVVQADGTQKSYTLIVQKQPGTMNTPVSLIVELPPDAEFLAATPDPAEIGDGIVTFALDLRTNVVVEVRYE